MEHRIWDKQRLYSFVCEELGDYRFVIISNREPYIHSISGDSIVWERPVGGLTQALDPVMCASGGIWIAHGSGDADRKVVDSRDSVRVPPDDQSYTLRRVWLTADEVRRYYLGFSNEGLWPLCHVAFVPPVFRENDWNTYQRVNRIFADAVIEETAGKKAVVLIQDYHFALLPRLLKERDPSLTVGLFWHIPWPAREIFRACPWQEEILDGLLGTDMLGFHIRSFCDNFFDSVEHALEGETDRSASVVSYRGHETLVQPFPISVDYEAISREAWTEEVDAEMETLRRKYRLEGKYVGIGTDRLDYTKGIPHRLRAINVFFRENPDYREKVVFIQSGNPSRSGIESYRALAEEAETLTAEINGEYGTDSWRPIATLNKTLSPVTMHALRRLADFCVVSSLHDGMNLVAKEYVSARTDGDGVLLLSKFAGAADELLEAVIINPYDTAGFARAIRQSIEMDEPERRRRMAEMRRIVSENTIYRWGADTVSTLLARARLA